MNQNKLKIIETIDKMQNELLTLSHQIHDHPELGFQEHQAVGFIRTFLKGHGFEVETPYCGLDTSFKAVKKGKHAGPRIAYASRTEAIGHSVGSFPSVSDGSANPLYDGTMGPRTVFRQRGPRPGYARQSEHARQEPTRTNRKPYRPTTRTTYCRAIRETPSYERSARQAANRGIDRSPRHRPRIEPRTYREAPAAISRSTVCRQNRTVGRHEQGPPPHTPNGQRVIARTVGTVCNKTFHRNGGPATSRRPAKAVRPTERIGPRAGSHVTAFFPAIYRRPTVRFPNGSRSTTHCFRENRTSTGHVIEKRHGPSPGIKRPCNTNIP